MAYFHTTVLDNQIKALPTVSTASGSVATFDTDMTENLVEVECDIVYQQASGTPTPDNPIPITVYNSLNLSHSGADTSNPNITNIPFGQTVAKGTLNVTTGVLELTHGAVELGTLTYEEVSGYIRNSSGLSDRKTGISGDEMKCSMLLGGGTIRGWVDNQNYTFAPWNSTATAIAIRYDGQTAATIASALSGAILVYPLATPQVIQLSATQITALLNENNIWCDTNGDTSVKYILSVGKAIS